MFQNILYPAFLCWFVKVNSHLRWEVKSSSVVFGEDATLTCQELGNVCTQARSWVGGNDYRLLCFNDTSRNPSKYQMISYKEKNMFDLVIKNFGDADVNCEYTCVCGFQQYTNRLQLTNISYIYPPNMNIADASYQNQHNCRFHLNVTIMKVYPQPECSIVYRFVGKIVHTEKVKLKIDMLKERIFYKIVLLNEYDLKHNITDKLSLSCTIGERHYEVYSWILELCSYNAIGGSDNISDVQLILLKVAIGTLLLIACCVCIGILLHRHHKQRRHNTKDGRSYLSAPITDSFRN